MTWVSVYDWERDTYPWHWQVKITPELRAPLARMIAQQYQRDFRVALVTNGGGRARLGEGLTQLPKPGFSCSLGLICHEVAHHVVYRYAPKAGHGRSFKVALVWVLEDTRRWLPRMIRLIKEKQRIEARGAVGRSRTAEKTARKAQAGDRRRGLRRQKMSNLRERIRGLETGAYDAAQAAKEAVSSKAGRARERLEARAWRVEVALQKAKRSLADLNAESQRDHSGLEEGPAALRELLSI